VGLVSPFIGPFFDSRHGPRIAAVGGGVQLAGSMFGLQYVEHLWQFILLFGIAGGLADLGSGFIITQGVVPKWFVRKRGRALGMAVAGVGLGATVFPGLVSALVEAVGWREAWAWFGLLAGVLSVLIGLLVRTRPEDVGLLPDGAERPVPRDGVLATVPVDVEVSLTRGEALRSPAFWMLLAAFTLVGFGIMGFQTNWVPYLLEKGFTSGQASFAILFYGVASGLSRPLWGIVGEFIHARFLMAGSTVFTGLSIVLFLTFDSLALISAYMAIAGVAMGGYLILQSLLTADYFGRAHIGAITAAMRPAAMISTASSPLIIGALYDLNGDYVIAFLFAAAAWVSAGFVVLLAKPPVSAGDRSGSTR
jgi:MFS family permease